MAKFEKGQSGNPAGRPAGSANTVKDWWDEFFEQDRPRIKKDWDKISPSLRMQLRSRYWDFQMPKLRSEHVSLDIDSMSEQVAGGILAELILKYVENGNEIRVNRTVE